MDADEVVRRFALAKFREEHPDAHKASCPDAAIEEPELLTGSYGCDTGCEIGLLEVEVTCPHEASEEFDYSDFGDSTTLLEDILEWEKALPR